MLTVAGCTGHSTGDDASPSVTQTVTETAAPSASSASPPTGSGVPATSTGPAGASSSGSSGNASGPGLCTPTVTTFALGPDDGAAGTQYFAVHVTNASRTPCVTTGWPGVALLDASGKQIVQATREGSGQPPTIVLQPGEQVTAQISVSDVPADGQTCQDSPAFLFTLPDNTDSTKINHTSVVCRAGVQAFVKGSGIG